MRRRRGLSAILTEWDHLNETVNAMPLSFGNAFVANETQMWIECNFDRVDHLNETVNAMSLSIGNAFVANETQMWIECNFDRAGPLERDCECDASFNWKCLRCQ